MKDSAVIETIEIFMEFVIMKTVIMRLNCWRDTHGQKNYGCIDEPC